MKKKRRYLKDLIPVNINKLVLETGYFEIQIDGTLLSLSPETHRCQAGVAACAVFVTQCPFGSRKLAQAHRGVLVYASRRPAARQRKSGAVALADV
jgi:hypothetical protein